MRFLRFYQELPNNHIVQVIKQSTAIFCETFSMIFFPLEWGGGCKKIGLTSFFFIIVQMHKERFQKKKKKLMEFSIKGPDPASQHLNEKKNKIKHGLKML